MTPSSLSPTTIAPKPPSSFPAKRQSTQKALRSYTRNKSSHTTDSRRRSSWTETPGSQVTSHENSADSWESNRTSVWLTTRRQTDKANVRTSPSNSTSALSVEKTSTHGQTGCHWRNTRETCGPPAPRRKPHTNSSWDTPHTYTSPHERPRCLDWHHD